MNFSSIDTLLRCFYSCISGHNNNERDWSLHASLFLPHARLIIATIRDGERTLELITPGEYARFVQSFIGDHPFFEVETAQRVKLIDSFAIIESDYVARFEPTGPVQYAGTNCLQLFNDGTRWWIVTAMWERKVKKPV